MPNLKKEPKAREKIEKRRKFRIYFPVVEVEERLPVDSIFSESSELKKEK